MSTQLNGEADIVSRPAAVSIASTTAATPIVVTTSTPHGLTTGDTVMVKALLHNIPGNGVFVVTVVDTTHVSLNSSVGSGAGGAESGATIQSLGFNATFAIPADLVDLRAAASVNVPFEALADRSVWSSQRVGPWWCVDENSSRQNDDTFTTWSTTVCTAGSDSWAAIDAAPYVTLYGAKTGDEVEITFQSLGQVNPGSKVPVLAFGWRQGLLGSVTKLLASATNLTVPVSINDIGVRMTARVALPASPPESLDIVVLARYYASGGPTIAMFGDFNLTARLWRPT